jgi:hypothetical protein
MNLRAFFYTNPPLHAHLPLQLAKMSMPSTCQTKQSKRRLDLQVDTQQTTQKETLKQPPDQTPASTLNIPDFLLYIHEPEYDLLLRELVRTSLTSVVQVFFADEWPQIASDLHQHTYTASRQDCLLLFYLMLNVDADLKKKITLLDKPQNRAKIGRFLYDLKHTLVPTFYTSEQISLGQFLLDCQDAYIIS